MVDDNLALLENMMEKDRLYIKLKSRYEKRRLQDRIEYIEPRSRFRVTYKFEGGTLKVWFEFEEEVLDELLLEEDIDSLKDLANDMMLLMDSISRIASHKWTVVKDVSTLLDLINILDEKEEERG